MESPKMAVDRDSLVNPRGLGRVTAATYIGVSVSKFDELVADGRMPKPRRIDTRKVWDRIELDSYFTELPREQDANPWDRLLPRGQA